MVTEQNKIHKKKPGVCYPGLNANVFVEPRGGIEPARMKRNSFQQQNTIHSRRGRKIVRTVFNNRIRYVSEEEGKSFGLTASWAYRIKREYGWREKAILL